MELPTTSAGPTEQEVQKTDVKPSSRKRYISTSSDDEPCPSTELLQQQACEISRMWNRMVDPISAEQPAMQEPQASSSGGQNEIKKGGEASTQSPDPMALWKMACVGPTPVQETADTATSQPGHVVMAAPLGLEVNQNTEYMPVRRQRALMNCIVRSTVYGVLKHCLDQILYEDCIGCLVGGSSWTRFSFLY